jgi:hypothetical protein
MEQVRNLWKPLIGQLVWSVRRGVGSFLTMEFGAPHLSIREPITPKAARSAKVRRALSRRRVFVEGIGTSGSNMASGSFVPTGAVLITTAP